MDETISKLFTGHLVINWKTKEMRVIKKAPKENTPFEIPIKIEIKLNLPKQPKIIAKGEIDIPPHKVTEMTIESL